MVGDKIKYSRSTIKYKGGNNMKELTYDELIKITVVIMKLIQTALLNMLVTGLAKLLMALKVFRGLAT